MLQSIRTFAHSWIVKTLMLFLIISFSIWGIGDIFRGNSLQKTVAKVGKVEISVQTLNRLFENALVEAKQKFDPNMTAQQAKQLGLMDQALEREITRLLIDMDLQRQGISVGPEAVLKILAEEPQFRAKDGTFNKQLFHQILQRQRMTEASFIAMSENDLARQLLLKTLMGTSFAPRASVDALYKARAQKRVLDVVAIDEAKIGGIPAPDEKALRDYYEANPRLFEAPEYRNVTMAILSTDTLAKDIAITDEQLKKEYDAKKEQLSTPERRNIVQVVMQDEEKARKLREEAHASGDLAAAAKANKEDPVPMDEVEESSLMPELSKTVFAMKEGAVAEPLKTQLGWHVVQLKKIVPAGVPSFEKLKDKMREDMRHEQSIEAATRLVNQLDDQLAAGHSLDDIADGLRLRLIKIHGVDAQGVLADGKKPAELPNKEQVLKYAFAQNAGETSPVEEDKAGKYFVVRTDDVTPAGVRPFDEVKTKVAAEWKANQQRQKAMAEAEKIAKSLGEGAALSSVKADEGVTTRSSEPLSLVGDTDKDLPVSLVAKAFMLKKGETAIDRAEGKDYVVRLASLTDVDPSKAEAARRNKVMNEIKSAANEELADQYVRYLRTIFPVKTNAELLNSLKSVGE